MILDDVHKLADELGLVVNNFILDATWHRVPVVGAKKKSAKDGAYCLSELTVGKDRHVVIVGMLSNHLKGVEAPVTLDDVEGASPEEIEDAKRRMREAAEESKKAKVKLQRETADKLTDTFARLPDEGKSEYLDRKKVKAYGIKFARGRIVVPACDVDGKLWTLQWINGDGTKRFSTGGAKRGRFHIINCPAGTHYVVGVVEGYATAVSIHEAALQSLPLAVAFDAGNLLPVGEALRSRHPHSRLIFFADHDVYKGYPQALIRERDASPAVREQVDRLARLRPDVLVEIVANDDSRLTDKDKHFNTGVTKALLAAAAVDGDVVVPLFESTEGRPTDFNDLAQIIGDNALGKQIANAIDVIDVDRRRPIDAPAQLSEGEKAPPDVENTAPMDEPDSDLPHENAARDDEFEREWRGKFERTNSGSLKGSVRNTELVLRHDEQWQGVLALCEFSHRVLKLKSPPMPDSDVGEWNDMDAAALRVWLAEHYGFTPNHGDLSDALVTVARSNSFHPVRDYLEELEWDGKPRLKDWLKLAFDSTEKDEYLELVGPKILVGAVARVMRPGCKAEEVMILEGRQGRGKSTVISILFGDWFSDSPLPIGKVAAQELIQGKWCFEIAELDAFHKAEVTALKQFLSQQIDRFRPAYGRSALDFPRQTQFWGSTNQDTYLRDYTGNRRFWPVFCAKVDKDWARNHRDQLWAEALQLYRGKFQWWVSRETPEREAEWSLVTDVQDSRMQADPWEGLLVKFFDQHDAKEHFHAHEILEGIGVDGGHQTQAHVNRIAPILRSLGWKNTRKRIPNGRGGKIQARVWINQDLLDEVPIHE